VTNPPPLVTARDPGLFHITAEPQVGLGHHLETAFYIETALWPDGSYHVSGAKLRGKWKAWFADNWPVQLAINGEVGNVDTNSDSYAWNAEIRPIGEAHAGPCRFFLNPNIGIPLGHDLHVGPDFEPQGKANCSLIFDIAPGLEYYTNLGPIFNWAPLRKEEQTLFYTVDVYRWPKVELGIGGRRATHPVLGTVDPEYQPGSSASVGRLRRPSRSGLRMREGGGHHPFSMKGLCSWDIRVQPLLRPDHDPCPPANPVDDRRDPPRHRGLAGR
jgi:hypothetical protein